MTNEINTFQKGPGRVLFTIPDFDAFAELLHDRLHAILYHMEELDSHFMLITNLFDRDRDRIEERKKLGMTDIESLVYSGTDRQRAILEKKDPVNYMRSHGKKWSRNTWRKERNPNWSALRHQQMTRLMKGVETFSFFDDFRKGVSAMSNITIGSLKDYFSGELNELKTNEKPIIHDFFDLNKDLYIGIPLTGLGKFQGIAWIIFKQKERKQFENKARIKRIIKLFELVYSDLAYSWEVSGKQSLIRKAIDETAEFNPIYEEIRLNRFYSISEYYQKTRLQKNDQVIEEIRNQLLRTATITILLDSFAHNISAHSLTALSWWFRERSEYLGDGKAVLEALGRDLNPLIRHFKLASKEENKLWDFLVDFLTDWPSDGDVFDLKKALFSTLADWQEAEEKDTPSFLKRHRPPTLSRELYPLFKFLLEKGAFWSGITRQTNFPGKISNFYHILWHDFVNNPLYLGTIANTEEVLKLHIRVTIYEKEERYASKDQFRNIKTIKKTSDGTLLDGVFGVINLQDFTMHSDPGNSVFVEKGALYQEIKEELGKIRVFMPGGVIGKHAFFTLLENEIRNVKHFHGEELKKIQKNGLTLNISIHERPFDSENLRPGQSDQLLKFGVWLNHPVDLDSDLLVKRIDNLDADIITADTARPRLGGNFQDKICASMLLTSSFNRVQDKDSAVGEIYYPWIKTAGSLIRDDKNKRVEFEVSQRRYRTVTPAEFNTAFIPERGRGYLKKYFHVWKGADILSIDAAGSEIDPADSENQGRYRFLHLQNATAEQYDSFKAMGIIRILSQAKDPKTVAEAYRLWLKKWMKTTENTNALVVDFREGDTDIGRLTYQNDQVLFENKQQIRENYEHKDKRDVYNKIPQRLQMTIAHGSQLSKNPEKLNYRTDGELIRHFCKGKELKLAQMDDEGEMYELLEAFAAKICIFDHRVYNRMYSGDASALYNPNNTGEDKLKIQIKRLEMYRENLRLDVRSEEPESWRAAQENDFLSLHFLIVHLSFMESLKDVDGIKYSEERILEFIDDQVLKGRPASAVGDDFVLVITTGRGRELWWETIKANPEYARFTTFRPIESILSAMEDAMQVSDDFNLKFNLTKLMFGS